MTCSVAARFRLDEISGVAVDMKAHVARVEPYDGVRLCGCVFHDHLCLLDGFGGGRSLLGADFIEYDEHCGVDGARYLEENSGNALHARDSVLIKFWCGCGVGVLFHIGPIRGCKPFVGRVLGERVHGVLEAF